MKKLITFFLTFCLTVLFFNPSKAIDASMSYATFKTSESGFVEVFLHIVGQTTHFATRDSVNFQSEVEVLILFKQGEKIAHFDKFALKSPVITLEDPMPNFIRQNRYALPDGEYSLEVEIKDQNKPDQIAKVKDNFSLNYSGAKLHQSDIQLIGNFKPATDKNIFTKHGYYMEYLPFNYIHHNQHTLTFYSEIYGTDKYIKDDFAVRYFIETAPSNPNMKPVTMLIGHKRLKPQVVNPLIVNIDIGEVPSGNYNLVVEVRSRKDSLLSSEKAYFQRSHPYLNLSMKDYKKVPSSNSFVDIMNEGELKYALSALFPITASTSKPELENVLKSKDINIKKSYLLSFWATKDPKTPKQAFDKYMIEVHKVNTKFSAPGEVGYRSDRGRVYLQYGPPSRILSEESDPSAPPYEIWDYQNFSKNQNQAKFVFFDPSLSGRYELLHSTARGEFNDPQWQRKLYKNNPQKNGNFIDDTDVQDDFGRHGGRNFRDF